MTRSVHSSVVTVVSVVALGALAVGAVKMTAGKRTPEPAKSAAAPVSTVKLPVDEGKLDPNDPKHGSRKLLNLDAPVYVDGVQRGVFRYGDLPAMHPTMLSETVPAFNLYEYLKGIGVAPEKVRAVHFHDNSNRIGSFEGSEIIKYKNEIKFTFQSGTTGTAVARWDIEGLKNEYSPHELRKVSIFVDKAVPPIKRGAQCHTGPDGECLGDRVPYVDSDPAKGTRLYADGTWAGFVKRRLIKDEVLMGETKEGETKYSVLKLANSFGADTTGAKAIELIAGDDVIGRLNADQMKRFGADLYFTLPKHGHGKLRVHVPAELQSKAEPSTDRDALVSAVLIYKSTTPPARDLTPISEDTDLSVQLAQGELREGEGLGLGSTEH
jgi:hypothetical protein